MDLVGFENTKVVHLFLAFRQEGQLYLPSAAQSFAERYKFAGVPTTLGELSGERVSFRHGFFEGNAIESFDIYNDGVIVESKSPSDLLDSFVRDVTVWMEKSLGMKRVETHAINKNYESRLVVRTEAPIQSLFEKLIPLQDLIGRLLNKAMGLDVKYHAVGFALSPELSSISSLKPIPFRFERRSGLAFETNMYYSSAPLPTDDHLRVLRELEKLAKG